MNYWIFDDIIDKNIQDKLEKYFLNSYHCKWIYHPQTVEYDMWLKNISRFNLSKNLTDNIKDEPYFVNSIVNGEKINNNDIGPTCAQLVLQFKKRAKFPIGDIIRMKSNLTLQKDNGNKYNYIHIDEDKEHYSLIYYVNDTDGNTVLFNNTSIVKEVEPKKGRILAFDGNVLHANRMPKNSNARCILNINMTKEVYNGA